MGSVCAEHHHHHPHQQHHNHHQGYKFHPLLSPKKSLQDLNIPPRKLLSRRPPDADYFSPSSEAAALMHKFLPSNDSNSNNSSSNDDGFDPDDDDPYSSDEFRMYEFKVRKCTRSRSHDWTDCPFSHPGEKARRRDPRRFHYSGTVCPEYRRSGGCSRGDECEFAHGVFECWLHPARYRTEACKDGKNCKRKVCFFAHSPRELRVLPVQDEGEEQEPCCHRGKHQHQHQHQQQQHCCRYCCALSPTSTLLGLQNFSPPMSPSLSPPMSPMKAVGVGARGLSRYSDRAAACGSKGLTYEDMVIADLLGSLEGMNLSDPNSTINKGVSAAAAAQHGRGLWVDVSGYDNSVGDDYHLQQQQQQQQQQMQFSNNPSVFSSSRNYFSPINNSDSSVPTGVNNNPNNNSNGMVDESPDLGWVNDLLM